MLHSSRRLVGIGVAAAVVACGGGPGLPNSSQTKKASGGSSTAYVVSGGTVTAYRLDSTAQRGSAVGTATTDERGLFELKLTEPTVGPLLLSLTGGSYIEPATGTAVSLSGGELTAIARSRIHVAGDVIGGVIISPISHLVAQLAPRYVRTNGLTVDTALNEAADLLNAHFGGIDWQSLAAIPDLTNLRAGVVQVNNETKAAIVLCGISMEARNLSLSRGLTPGGALNSFTLVTALADDLAFDGFFDGAGPQGGLAIPAGSADAYLLDGQTVRGMLAGAIRDFLSGTRNASQVTTADADPAALAIATDSNPRIFRDAGVGPTLTNAVTFASGDGSSHAPVNSSDQQLVSGTLRLLVTASSLAGVASLAVAQGATPLSPDVGSTLPTKFMGTFDTTRLPDGPVQFTATAKDVAGNVTTLSWQVVIDNTPPRIAVKQPSSGGYYSAVVPAIAAADDANGIATISEESFKIANTASVPLFSGSWTIPADQADGPVTLAYTACDVVFNCRTVPVDFFVDRTPPVVTVTAPPPRYTNSFNQAVRLVASATDGDGSGVRAVYVKNITSGAEPVAGVFAPGTNNWTFPSVGLVPQRDNVLAVYGVDAAIAADGLATGNSGLGRSPPFQQVATSLWSVTRPTPQWAPFASYYNEGHLQLVLTNPDPDSVTSWGYDPSVSYNQAGIAKSIVDLNNTLVVRKTTTRLSWFGTAPPVTDLVGDNSTNTPLIPYTIPFNAATDAPIASVTFTATVKCAGCRAFAPATGSLIRDTTFSGVRFLLPVTADAIPALAEVTSQATVSVLITAIDLAGNIGQITPAQEFQFQLVPPPVAVLEDTNYAVRGDPRSVFAFRLGDNTYTRMFNNPTFPTDTARFARYIAYNPAGKSLALSSQLGGVPADAGHPTPLVERWEAWSDYTPDLPLEGNCYQSMGVCVDGNLFVSPCGGANPTTYLSAGGRTCVMPKGGLNPETLQDSWQLNALPYELVAGGGEQLPAVASNNGVVIPAANANIVGRVAIYLSVPSRAIPGTLTWDTGTARYQYLYGQYDSGLGPQTSCTCDRSGPPNWCPAAYTCYAALQPWYLYLGQAESRLYGLLSFNTSNLAPGANATTVLGPPSASSSLVFSRAIAH